MLQANLRTFSKLASSLRGAHVRNVGQVAAVEQEIDMLRKALGYGEGFRCDGCVACNGKAAA